jgi:large subunit ribosomal protein L9
MKVILKTNIDKMGAKGEVKEVKDGFARNYLIPKGLAVESNAANLKRLEEEQVKIKAKEAKDKEEAQVFAKELENHSYTISSRAGVDDKLYGAITSQDIADCIKQEVAEIDKKKIQLDEPIKKLGIYQIPIKIYPDVVANIKVWIVKE